MNKRGNNFNNVVSSVCLIMLKGGEKKSSFSTECVTEEDALGLCWAQDIIH